MSRIRYEYMMLEVPFAIPKGEFVSDTDNPHGNIVSAKDWIAKLNEVGEDGWEYFRYEFGRWFFRRVKES